MLTLEPNNRKKILDVFSANLPNYRKEMKLSQEEFGDVIGITRQTISSIERGAYPLTWPIFLSSLLVCARERHIRKMIYNSFIGEEEITEYLDELIQVGYQEYNQNYEGSARQIGYGICTIKDEPEYPVIEMEPVVCEMLGHEEVIAAAKKSYLALVYEEDRDFIRQTLDKNLRKQMVICLEHRIRSYDGQIVLVQCFIRRQKKLMKDGLFDVTITQVSAEMLRKRQLIGLMGELPVGVAVFEYSGRPGRDNIPEIFYANEAFYQVIGYSAEQFLSMHKNYLLDIVSPYDVSSIAQKFDMRSEEKQNWEVEFRVNRYDGSMAWVQCRANVISHNKERGYLVNCSFTDITRRVNNELQMRNQLDRYRSLDDITDHMSLAYDVEKDELTLPTNASDALGHEEIIENFLGNRVVEKLIHEEDLEEFNRLFTASLALGQNGKGEFRILFADGTHKWVRLHLVSITNGEGETKFVYLRAMVIEEEKRIRTEHNNDRILINRLSTTDRLTGLYNKQAFRTRVQEVIRAQDMGPVHAIVYCDINSFSYINEKYGYVSGDRILRDFGAMFLKKGKKCFGCRLHSDYFLLYINGDTKEQVVGRIKTWRKSFIEQQKKYFPGIDLKLTCGLYFCKRGETDASQMIDCANMARKYAKSDSGKWIGIWTEELRQQRNNELAVVGDISNAIRNGQIEVFLQPKFSMKNMQCIGAEALARWKNEDGTYRAPAEFIPALEKAGKTSELDFCVYTTVLQILRKWKRNGSKMVPVSMNFSNSKNIEEFDVRISRLAEQYGVEGRYIDIEFDEYLIQDHEKDYAMLARLKRQGFRLVLDKFGSGTESMYTLMHAPVDRVKLGRGFIEGLGGAENAKCYVHSMCDMIKAARKEAVFSGLETEQEQQIILNCGFVQVQGYLYEYPLPVQEFEEKYLDNQ